MAEHSEHVWYLSFSVEDKSVELKAFLEAHPDVDVNLHRDKQDQRALHGAAGRGNVASTRLLIDARADLEVRDKGGQTSLFLASHAGNLECLQVLIESKADVKRSRV
jgi:ankyrin repeat protein